MKYFLPIFARIYIYVLPDYDDVKNVWKYTKEYFWFNDSTAEKEVGQYPSTWFQLLRHRKHYDQTINKLKIIFFSTKIWPCGTLVHISHFCVVCNCTTVHCWWIVKSKDNMKRLRIILHWIVRNEMFLWKYAVGNVTRIIEVQ